MLSEMVLNVKKALSGRRVAFWVACVVLLSVSVGRAQEDRSPKRGFQSPGSYALSDLESISTTNGNMIVRLPLASLPAGRGGNPGYTFFLIYNSKIWNSRQKLGTNGCTMQYDECIPNNYTYEELAQTEEGGWHYGLYYQLELTSRWDLEALPNCIGGSQTDPRSIYVYKLKLTFPDGSVHEFRPSGYNDPLDDGYFSVNPNGYQYNHCDGSHPLANSTGMTYYSTDGTFMRLEVDHVADSGNDGSTNSWSLYMPNGTKVVSSPAFGQRIYDRNDNYIEIKNNTVSDQLGRSISLEPGTPGGTDIIRTKGFGGEELITQVVWRQNWVHKTYQSTRDRYAPDWMKDKTFSIDVGGVGQVILPSQAGGLTYSFDYNGKATAPAFWGDYSTGWGELNSITLPSGARATYKFSMDSSLFIKPEPKMVLRSYPTQKVLAYRDEYDLSGSPSNAPCESGTSGCITEKWFYDITSMGSSVTAPDGGVTSQAFVDTEIGYPDSGLVYKAARPDGGVSEQIWEKNLPHQNEPKAYNWYVRTEFNSIPNASGAPVKTAIKDYDYDKNGNVIALYEYDWINYSDIPRNSTNQRINLTRDGSGRITGIPGLVLRRVTKNSYYNQAPAASSSPYCMSAPVSEGCQNIYVFRNLNRRLYNLIASSEVSDGTQTFSRTEFSYNNTETKGNVTEQKSWDSFKNGTAQSLTRPLTASNSISVQYGYDSFGNVTLTTDARGIQTEVTYGNISGPAGQLTDLYPTQTKAAFGKPEQRTSTQEYDFYTGLVTRAKDVDNNVETESDYDVFGRPKEVRGAANIPALKTVTRTEYSDINRRVIVRSDLNTAYDGKLVSIQHYDQLGRVRLTRQLEDACAGCDTDETKGIKVQTRYYVDEVNHLTYQLVSNPYRADYSNQATSEATMGWTRSKSDKSGRVIEVQTFSGSSVPNPWSTNSRSTGTVLTSYDSFSTTVTDQAGKTRKSEVDALGRLVKVFEDPQNLNYETGYTYDVLGNLTQVTQGTQTRSFSYSSVSRLSSATNPESGTISYQYDNNGNLTSRTDARGVVTAYSYDALNRVITRSYSDSTPSVAYTYDTLLNGKGRLTSVSSIVSTTNYTSYDALGRITSSSQTTDGHPAYTFNYSYDLAGNLRTETYPSGRVVETEYDTAGRMAGVKKQGGSYYAGGAPTDTANRIQYTAHGGISALKLGNNLWEHTGFNSRLQPTEIGLGTATTNSNVLQLDYSYSTTNNNGNVQTQTIATPGLSLTQTYTYDQLNRLKTFNEAGGLSQVYEYDRYGNRAVTQGYVQPQSLTPTPTSPSAFNQNNNRITNASYDAAGNLTAAVAGHSFSYDAENRMTSHDDSQTVGVVDDRYSYDGDGRRVKKVHATVTTIFVYNVMGQLVAEYSDSNQTGAGGTSYLTSDTLGTPRAITDGSGQVKSRHDYLPFGEELQAGTGGRTTGQGYSQPDGTRKNGRNSKGMMKPDSTTLRTVTTPTHKGALSALTRHFSVCK